MKVALLIDEYRHAQAGTERQLLLLCRELQARGHAVRFGVLRDTPFTASGRFPVHAEVLGIRRISDPRSWVRLYRWGRSLARDGYRLVHLFFNDAALLGPWPLKLAGLRVVVSRRDMGFWCTPATVAGLRLASPAVSAMIANSRAAGEAARGREWLARSKLRIVHNGVEAAPERGADTGLGVPPAPTGGRVGIVANVRPVKRIGDLVEAFARIAGEHADTDLVIVGGGDTADILAGAQRLGIENRIRLTGQLEEPREWIRTFTVGVLCSESEGLSNAVLEYMQAGLPVVATDTGGNPELVSDGRTGLLVPVGDPAALAAALGKLLGDPALARRMGDAGARKLAEEFGVDRMLNAHLALYRELLDASACAQRSPGGEST